MIRRIGLFLAVLAFIAAGRANAQEARQGPGTLEVTIIPGGGMFFTGGTNSPSFGNYQIGVAPAYNFNRIVGVEGEIGGSIGISDQNVLFTGPVNCPSLPVGTSVCGLSGKAPNTLNYSGNLVVNAPAGHSVVPYATGGIGGMTMFQRASLGVTSSQTFLTGNVGGGVKWYAPNGRWGLRGDYRFIAVRSENSAPLFFGRDNRYGHRIYGAVIINALQ